jgi:hypothetical protein
MLNKNFPKYFYIISIYSTLVCIIYEFAYWPSFDINIVEFISIADLAGLAIYPAITTGLFLLLSTGLNQFSIIEKYLPKGDGRYAPMGIFLNKHKKIIVLLFWIPAILVYFYANEYSKWIVLPYMIVMPLPIIQYSNTINKILPISNVSYYLLLIIILIPLMAYAKGKMKALDILLDYNYKYIFSSEIESTLTSRININQKLKYIGKAGQYIFLMSEDNSSTLILNSNNFRIIKLRKF